MVKKYFCKLCNYETDIHCNYQKHIKTKKHKNKEKVKFQIQVSDSGDSFSEIGDQFSDFGDNSIKCEYCNRKINFKKNLHRHLKSCKEKIKYDIEVQKKELELAKLTLEQEKLAIQKKQREMEENQRKMEEEKNNILEEKNEMLEKFNNYLLKLWEEQTKQPIVNNIQNNIKIDSLNITYIKKNFLDAYNYEDLMDPLLTNNEIKLIENSPINGCYELVKSRCIDNIELEKRPIHCVDAARKKYALRTNDEWTLDYNGNKILNGVDNKISWLIKNYDLNNVDHRNKHLKILQGMLSDKYKIMDYLKDDVILKENVKLLNN